MFSKHQLEANKMKLRRIFNSICIPARDFIWIYVIFKLQLETLSKIAQKNLFRSESRN